MPGMSDSTMLDGLTAETIDALVDVAGPGSGSPLLMVELRHLGGALGRYAGGALSRFDGEYLYFAAGVPMDPAVVAALEAHFAHRRRAPWRPHSSGRQYLNFAERAIGPGRVLRRGDLRPPAPASRPRSTRWRSSAATTRSPRVVSATERAGPARTDAGGAGRATSAASWPWRPPPRGGGAGPGAGPRPRSRGRSPSAPAARRRCAPPRASCASIVPEPAAEEADRDRHQAGERSATTASPRLSGPGHTGGLSTIITTDAITPKATPVSAPAVLKRRQRERQQQRREVGAGREHERHAHEHASR